MVGFGTLPRPAAYVLVLLLLPAIFAATAPAFAGTYTIHVCADLQAWQDGNHYEDLLVGRASSTGSRARALLKFDLSAIPADATIDAAVLYIFQRSYSATDSSASLAVYAGSDDSWTDAGGTGGFTTPFWSSIFYAGASSLANFTVYKNSNVWRGPLTVTSAVQAAASDDDVLTLCVVKSQEYTGDFRANFENREDSLVNSAYLVITTSGGTDPTSAMFPFTEGFESGGLASYWQSYSSDALGRVQVTNANSPHSGSYHLTMDREDNSGYTLNEAVLTIDLAGRSDVTLDFWHKDLGDEYHSMPSSFSDHCNGDGVAISADGSTWYRVDSLASGTSAYTVHSIDLDSAIAGAGISYNGAFKIKFQQYDNGPIVYTSGDGFAFDDIAIYGPPEPRQLGIALDTEDPVVFAGTAAGANPPTQSFRLYRWGTGTLNWEVTDDADWLTCSPSSGTNSGEYDTIAMSVDITGLGAGTHTGTITVSDPAAFNSPRTLDVSLELAAPVTIERNPATLSFTGMQGEGFLTDQTFTVRNSGSGTLNWSVADNADWLTLTPTSGDSTGEEDTVTARAYVSPGRAPGTHNGTITISDANAANSPQTIAVSLEVTPAPIISRTPDALNFTATCGGDDPEDQTLSISNIGGDTLQWSVTDDADWLSLDPVNGTDAGTVTLSVDIGGLTPASRTATVTITDEDALNSPQTCAVTLELATAAPILSAEPAMTPGTSNQVSWTDPNDPDADEYLVECAADEAFNSIIAQTPWLAANTYTFGGLEPGNTYFYRAMARFLAEPGDTGEYSETTEDDFNERNDFTRTCTQAPGDVVLAQGELTPRISCPSFESTDWQSYWTISGGSPNVYGERIIYYLEWPPTSMPTHGDSYIRLYTFNQQPVVTGDKRLFSQSVDLTGVNVLQFDYDGTGIGDNIEARVYVDDTVVWSSRSSGAYSGVPVNISGYVGEHTLAFGLYVIAGGTFDAQFVRFDNFRIFGGTAYPTSGNCRMYVGLGTSWGPPFGFAEWEELTYNCTEPAGTDIRFDIMESGINDNVLVSDVASGSDLSELGVSSSLYLRVTFTGDGSTTPVLHDWSVSWKETANTFHVSPWSDTEQSTQVDAPDLAMSGLRVSRVCRTEAVVNWETNLAATSQVGFGTASQAGFDAYPTTAIGPGGLLHHAVQLSGLTEGTTYYLRAKSVDVYGRSVVSDEISFTTSTLQQPSLVYSGDALGTDTSTVTLAGTLSCGGTHVVGASVAMVCGNWTGTAVTGADGRATIAIAGGQLGVGTHTVYLRFAGDATYLPASGRGQIMITKDSTNTIVRGEGAFFRNDSRAHRCMVEFRFNADLATGWLELFDVRAQKRISVAAVTSVMLSPDADAGPQAIILCGPADEYTVTVNADTNAFSIVEGSPAAPTYQASTASLRGDVVIEEGHAE